jgi:hypothetical protein
MQVFAIREGIDSKISVSQQQRIDASFEVFSLSK